MAKLRAHNISMSLDGYGAGRDQSIDNPLGVGGEELHEWVFRPRTAADQLDEQFIARGDDGIGATIMGRNMFGPFRGPWVTEQWTGWWGDDPPYHHPVFVLTHHLRPSITKLGGTVFHFVDGGIEAALKQAFAAAGGQDVRLGGGMATIQEYMRAGLLDELHVAIAPILLGAGERLFDNLGPDAAGYECTAMVSSPSVVHATFAKTV